MAMRNGRIEAFDGGHVDDCAAFGHARCGGLRNEKCTVQGPRPHPVPGACRKRIERAKGLIGRVVHETIKLETTCIECREQRRY